MNRETGLQNRIIAHLNSNGCYARNHTVGVFYTQTGQRIKIGNHGESDIYGHRCCDGKRFYIEVKMPGEKPRPDQLKFIEAMKKMGAIAGWCTSIEEREAIVFEN